MSLTPRQHLLGLSLQELTSLAEQWGQPAYRGRQLFDAIYRQRESELERVSTLPAELRKELSAKGVAIGLPRIQKQFQSSDGTIRYLLEFADGQSVETVWMPEGDDGESGDGSEADPETEASAEAGWQQGRFHRATICVSSQAGCAVSCQFCMTAQLGLLRNLSAGEIAGQVLAVLRERKVEVESERINLVFMGQGEPFLNYENFMKAVQLLVQGVGIPVSRMTVSTSGVIPRIQDFGAEELRPKLAISLNASTQQAREQVMPITKKWELAQLLAAAREFPLGPRERLTFEYVLLHGVNDTPEDARRVAEMLRGMKAKVNLIALNPGPGIEFKSPEQSAVDAFQKILVQSGIPAYVRRPRGRDIFAACGQLRRTVA